MFLDSTYEFTISDSPKQRFSSLDVAAVLNHIAPRCFYERGMNPDINVGLLQVGAYLVQGYYIATNGISLFEDNFMVSNDELGTIRIGTAFGGNNKVITDINLSDTIKSALSGPLTNMSVEQNKFVQKIGHKYLYKGYKELMKEIRESEPFKNAKRAEDHIIKKADMKVYFEEEFMKSLQGGLFL